MYFTNKELILFDLDGTLVDSAPDLALSLNMMLESLDKKPYPLETIHSWVGNGALTLTKRALSGSKEIDTTLDTQLVNQALDLFLKFYAKNVCVKTQPYDGVKETLKYLQDKNYKMAIVTNKPYAYIEPILTTLKLEDFFTLYIGADSLDKKKPDPMPLLHLSSTLNVAVQNCVMVGDSKNDIIASQAANMESIAVSYGYNYDEDIAIYKPTVIIDSFSQIQELL